MSGRFKEVQLSELASIRLGVSLRTRLHADPSGSVYVVQASDLGANGAVVPDHIVRATVDFADSQILAKGDILLQSRGVSYPAARLADCPHVTIAAAPLYVLRPSTSFIDPTFLVFFLNHETTQLRLRRAATGTHVPQLTRRTIENIRIPLPPLKTQSRIVQAAALARREHDLVEELYALRMVLLYEKCVGRFEEQT